MNSLRDFLRKYFHIFFFFILLIFAIVLVYNNNNYQNYAITTSSQGITGPIQKFSNNFYRQFKYFKENESLMIQNIELLRLQENMFITNEDSTYTISSVGVKKTRKRLYDFTTAHVIFNTIHKTNNYIIIDKGKKDGITTDMAVLSPQGIVGVVSDVSANFSTVISLLNPNSRVSAKIMPINQLGTVIWVDYDPTVAQVIDIPQHLMIAVGDSVLTSGNSDVYPKDLLIGTVIEKYDNSNNTFLTIKIKLAADFRNLHNVYVINNLYKPELDSLKSQFKND